MEELPGSTVTLFSPHLLQLTPVLGEAPGAWQSLAGLVLSPGQDSTGVTGALGPLAGQAGALLSGQGRSQSCLG